MPESMAQMPDLDLVDHFMDIAFIGEHDPIPDGYIVVADRAEFSPGFEITHEYIARCTACSEAHLNALDAVYGACPWYKGALYYVEYWDYR